MAGGFMTVHLAVNASVLNSPETFQNNVYAIHALDKILPIVEWALIFAPLLFHAVVGVFIANNAAFNQGQYRYGPNYRYTIQRITGYVLFFFVLYHVFHMHGWLHFGWWQAMIEPWGGHQFRPFNASSTAGDALQSWIVTLVYAIGVVCGVYHFANGVWTAGITWGLWTSPNAQQGALKICTAAGAGLCLVGLAALFGMRMAGSPENINNTQADENRIYDARVQAGSVVPNEHKRVHSEQGESTSNNAVPLQPSDD